MFIPGAKKKLKNKFSPLFAASRLRRTSHMFDTENYEAQTEAEAKDGLFSLVKSISHHSQGLQFVSV